MPLAPRVAQPALQPAHPAAVAAALHGARRLDQVLALCHCAAEAWTLCSVPPGSAELYAAQCLLLAAQAALLAFFLRASWGQWRRRRAWAIGAMRLVAVAHVPLLYGPQAAGLGQLLNRAASPGALGAAADWFRLVAGILPSTFIGTACRLPPAAALVQQAAVVGLSTAGAGSVRRFCGSQLLSDPLSAQRIASLHHLLDGSDLLGHSLPAGVGSAAGVTAAGNLGQQCAALYYFLALVIGVLLPAALSLRAKPLPPLEQPAVEDRRPWRGGAALVAGLRQVAACRPAAALLGWLLLSTGWLACKVLSQGPHAFFPPLASMKP